MNDFKNELRNSFGVELADTLDRNAAYNRSLDFVEYIGGNAFCISRRVDECLTLILDEDRNREMVGFRLKGFACIFSALKEVGSIGSDCHFLAIEDVLLEVINDLPKDVFRAKREDYKQVLRFARENDVKVSLDGVMAA